MNEDISPLALEQLTGLIALLFAVSNGRVNIERAGGRLRLRYIRTDPKTGQTRREALELPANATLAERLDNLIRHHREMKGGTAILPQYNRGSFSIWAMAASILAPDLRIATRHLWSIFATTIVAPDEYPDQSNRSPQEESRHA